MRLISILRYFCLLTFGYLLLISLSFGEPGIIPIFIILIGIWTWWLGKETLAASDKFGSGKTFLIILLIGGVIRILWAIYVPSLPVSDFQYYNDSALHLSQGIPTLTKNMGYTILLSLGYRIYPSIIVGKIINAIASTLSIALIYRIGSRLINPQTGLLAALILSIFPSEVIMVSVLGTEIVGTTLILISSLLLFSIYFKKFNISLVFIFLTGLFYGLALTVRSSFLFYIPAIILFIFLIGVFTLKQKFVLFTIFIVGITASLSLFIIYYSYFVGRISIEPILMQDSFPLLSGTNVDSTGGWNQSDADLYFSWPSNLRDKLARQVAFERIVSNPKEFLELIPKKISALMGPNTYGSLWSLDAIDWGQGNSWGIRAPSGVNWSRYAANKNTIIRMSELLLQSTYVVTLFLAVLPFRNQKISILSLIVLTVTIFTLLPHVFLEVQSRYHHYIAPFIILLASSGMLEFHAVKKREFT